MPSHPPKLTRDQLAEQIHGMTFEALDRRDYRAVAALVRALEILDEPAPEPAPVVRTSGRDTVVWLPHRGATRSEFPRHGHLAAVTPDYRCAVCGTTGVRACLACWDTAPGTVRAEGGQCGMCGAFYAGRGEAGPGPTGDGDRDLAALATAVRSAGAPGLGEARTETIPAVTGCPDCPDFVPDSLYHLAQHAEVVHGAPPAHWTGE